MARCLFAVDTPVGYGPGIYTGGPMKVVWHKTQGDTLAGALAVYHQHQLAPHFTADEHGIVHQHFDTSGSSFGLVHAGNPETNRDGAVQIEVVGWVGRSMTAAQLEACRQLSLWCEQQHAIPRRWPLGRPTGNDRRDGLTWDAIGGHYGHSNVPENTHTDPAWTDEEWAVLSFAAPAPVPAPPPTPVWARGTINGVPVKVVPVTIPTDAVGDGSAACPAGTLLIASTGAHDKYDPNTGDKDSVVVPVGQRPSGAGFRAVVAKGPANTTVVASVLVSD